MSKSPGSEHLSPPIRTLMKGIQHLLVQPKIELPDLQKEEERENWKSWRTQLGYIAYLGGLVKSASSKESEELETSLEEVGDVMKVVTPLYSERSS